MNAAEPTNKEIMVVVNGLTGDVHELKGDVRELKGDVHELKGEMQELKGDVHDLKGDVQELKGEIHELKGMMSDTLFAVNEFASKTERRFEIIEADLTSVKSVMVTKDYLDDKLAILRGDILHVIRKEDSRVTRLIEILEEKAVISKDDVKLLETLMPLTAV